jgi:hypothetical protein
MLKAIVEHKNLTVQVFQRPLARGSAIGIGNYGGDSAQVTGEKERFIPGFTLTGEKVRSVRNHDLRIRIGSAVSSGEHANLLLWANVAAICQPFVGQHTTDPFNHWSFSSSPSGDVTDADDRRTQLRN